MKMGAQLFFYVIIREIGSNFTKLLALFWSEC